MELCRAASRASEAVAPMLYHYSWHCFNSFLVYSFFWWEPQHTRSHGIQISLSDNIGDIEVKFLDRGLFKRLIDTWTLLGASLAFSRVLPVYEDEEELEKIVFVPNSFCILQDTNRLSLKQLLSYDSDEFEKDLHRSNLKGRIVHCPFMINSIHLPTKALKNYLIVFVASSMARYRPNLWSSASKGETEEESDLALLSGRATVDYTVGFDATTGYLYQVSRVLNNVANGKMTFTWA